MKPYIRAAGRAIARTGAHVRDNWQSYALPPATGAVAGALVAEIDMHAHPFIIDPAARLALDAYVAGAGALAATSGAYVLGALDAGMQHIRSRITNKNVAFDPERLGVYGVLSLSAALGLQVGMHAYRYGGPGAAPHQVLDAIRAGTLGSIAGAGAGAAAMVGVMASRVVAVVAADEIAPRMRAPSWFFPKARARRHYSHARAATTAADALRYADRALRAYPRMAEAYTVHGAVACISAEFEKAQNYYERALGGTFLMPAPTREDVREALAVVNGVIEHENNRRETALKCYREAVCAAERLAITGSADARHAIGRLLDEFGRNTRKNEILPYAAQLGLSYGDNALPPDRIGHFSQHIAAQDVIRDAMRAELEQRGYRRFLQKSLKTWDGSCPSDEVLTAADVLSHRLPDDADAAWSAGAAHARAYATTKNTNHYYTAMDHAARLRQLTDGRATRLAAWLDKLSVRYHYEPLVAQHRHWDGTAPPERILSATADWVERDPRPETQWWAGAFRARAYAATKDESHYRNGLAYVAAGRTLKPGAEQAAKLDRLERWLNTLHADKASSYQTAVMNAIGAWDGRSCPDRRVIKQAEELAGMEQTADAYWHASVLNARAYKASGNPLDLLAASLETYRCQSALPKHDERPRNERPRPKDMIAWLEKLETGHKIHLDAGG